MSKIVQKITDDQVDQILGVLRGQLEGCSSLLLEKDVQKVLKLPRLGIDLLSVFLRHVEVVAQEIIRIVVIQDTDRTPQEALNATNRRDPGSLCPDVIDSMPTIRDKEAEIRFFKVNDSEVSDDELTRHYDIRGLKPVDPLTLAALNEADPAFADQYDNCTHWQDADGNWCHLAFNKVCKRQFIVKRSSGGWDNRWWFAGVCK